MRTTKRISFSILLGLLLCIAPSVYAQVSIGVGEEPVAGALLQLKDQTGVNSGAANSTKGLGMPRVALTDLSKLQPMYSYVDATAVNTPDATAKDAHIGLWLYNTNQCLVHRYDGNASGLYVWDGTLWQSMTKPDAVLPTATPSETSGADNWGGKVIRHQAKAGVYEEFTSAYFGATAGRWMTTNLSAKAYDKTGVALPAVPNASGGETIQWSYPNNSVTVDATNGGPLKPIQYTANKSLGLLYSWAAAVNMGPDTGQTPEPENIDESLSENSSYTPRQGICPNGWHLPSYAEWTTLGQEFTDNKNKYSSLANDAHNSKNGNAMKDVCVNFDTDAYKGASKAVSQGGFSALLAGHAFSGSSQQGFGRTSNFWSSSSYGSFNAYCRSVSYGDSTLTPAKSSSSFLFSVRCKKD